MKKNNNQNKEYKSFPFEIKEIYQNGDYGIIKGYASTFGNVDLGNDRVIKGAFLKTLQKCRDRNRKIRMFFQHDQSMVIGGYPVYREDEKGLYVEGEINLKVEKGREVYELAKQGIVTDLSIGYYAPGKRFVMEDGKQIRELTEIELYEISPVTNPMNEDCEITDVKSETITDISKRLKGFGLSNKEANELIFDLKNILRNEMDDSTRNDDAMKVKEGLLTSKIDNIIKQLERV